MKGQVSNSLGDNRLHPSWMRPRTGWAGAAQHDKKVTSHILNNQLLRMPHTEDKEAKHHTCATSFTCDLNLVWNVALNIHLNWNLTNGHKRHKHDSSSYFTFYFREDFRCCNIQASRHHPRWDSVPGVRVSSHFSVKCIPGAISNRSAGSDFPQRKKKND